MSAIKIEENKVGKLSYFERIQKNLIKRNNTNNEWYYNISVLNYNLVTSETYKKICNFCIVTINNVDYYYCYVNNDLANFLDQDSKSNNLKNIESFKEELKNLNPSYKVLDVNQVSPKKPVTSEPENEVVISTKTNFLPDPKSEEERYLEFKKFFERYEKEKQSQKMDEDENENKKSIHREEPKGDIKKNNVDSVIENLKNIQVEKKTTSTKKYDYSDIRQEFGPAYFTDSDFSKIVEYLKDLSEEEMKKKAGSFNKKNPFSDINDEVKDLIISYFDEIKEVYEQKQK